MLTKYLVVTAINNNILAFLFLDLAVLQKNNLVEIGYYYFFDLPYKFASLKLTAIKCVNLKQLNKKFAFQLREECLDPDIDIHNTVKEVMPFSPNDHDFWFGRTHFQTMRVFKLIGGKKDRSFYKIKKAVMKRKHYQQKYNSRQQFDAEPVISTGINKVAFKPLPVDQQVQLKDRCDKQNWVGICDANFKDFGRGVVSLQEIQKDDIILDFHGEIVTGLTFEQLINTRPDIRQEYCLEISKSNPRRIIDAGSEICAAHSHNRCLGRLINHANSQETENTKLVEILLGEIYETEKRVMVKAKRRILPFEQLCYDYGDITCKSLF